MRFRLAVFVEVAGELRVGALVFAPHVADPRLSAMRCGWDPSLTSYCGRVGKVIKVRRRHIRLYSCGREIRWDIQLFDRCLTRLCYKGCQLQCHVAAMTTTPTCSICLARVPAGAEAMRCAKHRYDVCTYCLGRPCLPAVGDKVIRGPTWSAELPLPEGADYYEEGVVESGLLDVLDTAELSGDDIEGPLHRYQLGFQVYRGIPSIVCLSCVRGFLKGGLALGH